MRRKHLLLSGVLLTTALAWAIYAPGAAEAKATEALDQFLERETQVDGCLRQKHGAAYSIKLTDEIFTTYEFVVTFAGSGAEMYFRVEESGWLFWTSYAVDNSMIECAAGGQQ